MRFDVLGKFDVIIIGSGISGLICALELAKANKSVCIVTKEAVTESASLYAQGGIAVPLNKSDSIEGHLADTLKAGAGLCDVNVTREIISYSTKALEKLVLHGVKFDSTPENLIHQTKEAAHSVPRVCHVGGDASGKFITKTLIDKACREPNISISQGSIALSIIKSKDNKPFGVLVSDVTRSSYVLLAKDIIVASGGIGQIYKDTTNPKVCTGDGIAMSFRTGAELQDIEMIQFHPTVLLEKGDPLLITEAIRGEGAKLKNIMSEYFASKYHELAELAPRDILSRAISREMEKTKSRCVYLDVSNFKIDYFKDRFPTIYKSCLERKIDLFNTGIPVSPASHYFIGGVKCDVSGKTSIPHLWVVGEAASNGLHGANRLASNSLLECIVVPHFLVKNLLEDSLNEKPDDMNINNIEVEFDKDEYKEEDINITNRELQERNLRNLGLFRNGNNLNNHLIWLHNTAKRLNIDKLGPNYTVQELKNMVLLSTLICNAAIQRKNSLGAHFREDYPDPPAEFKHSAFKLPVELVKPLAIFFFTFLSILCLQNF